MISVTDLRSGIIFEENNQPWQVMVYEHTKLGRGTANIKVKVKNLRTGTIVERNFINGARVNEAAVSHRPVQYLYTDGEKYYFMDTATFEQFEISKAILAENAKFLKEGMNLTLISFDDEPLNVELPMKMEFTVAEAGPGVRGNSATNIYKDAVLDNGLKTRIPLFINAGEKVIIDTRTGEYVERSK